MALFTNKADENLPILTKFYQVDSKQEIFDLATAYDSFLKNVQEEEEINMLLEPLLELHGLVKLFMDSCADNVDISYEKISKLVILINRTDNTVVPCYINLPGKNSDYENMYMFNGDQSQMVNSRCVRFLKRIRLTLFQCITEELRQITIRKKEVVDFLRCEECKNVFVIQSEGQRYCSQRCRSRVGERRRYATRMEGYQTKKRRKS